MINKENIGMTGRYLIELRDVSKIPEEDQKPGVGKLVETIEVDNVICTIGKNAIADQLANEQTYDLKATYVATGTGAGTPNASDTTLFTELARAQVSFDSATGNVASIQGFFSESQSNGSLTEIGCFCDGSNTQASVASDSGILLSHATISLTKTSANSLTVQFQITVN